MNTHCSIGFAASYFIAAAYFSSTLLYADDGIIGQQCSAYNPASLKISRDRGEWLVVAGSRILIRLTDESDALRFVAIAKQFRVQCTVLGSNDPVEIGLNRVLFWREPIAAKFNEVKGEDCLEFDANRLRIKNLGTQGFQMDDGLQVLLTMKDRVAAEAALAAAQERKVMCFIGRGRRKSLSSQWMQVFRGASAQLLQYLR